MAVTIDEILARGQGPIKPNYTNDVDPNLDGQKDAIDQKQFDSASEGALERGDGPLRSNFLNDYNNATEEPVPKRHIPGTTIELTGNEKNISTNTTQPDNASSKVDGTAVSNHESTATNDVSESSKETPVPNKPKRRSYVELYQELSPYKPKTDEEIEKERKKQKRESVFAAIGDGIAALSNLYFTSQYAPNAYDPRNGMSATTKARFDKLKKEREDNQREYMEGYLRAMKMDDDAGYKETFAQMKEREQKRKESETNITIALKQADLDYKEAKKDGQSYLNELYRLKGHALEAGMDAQVALIEEKIKTEKAKQQKYRSGGSGGGSRSSGGTATKKYPVFNADGDVVDHVYTKDEAVSETERNGGSYPGNTRGQSQTQQNGRRTKTTTVTSTTTPHAGRQPRTEKKTNPMGGSGNGGNHKKKNPMS